MGAPARRDDRDQNDGELPSRLRAVADLLVPEVREMAGRHEYDGIVQDLSRPAVDRQLARLGGPALDDPFDDACLRVFERRLAVEFGQAQMHRRNPRLLLAALDLAVYDRPYAPVAERKRARAQHLAGWPDGIEAALPSLDMVSAPAARALLPAVRGAAAVVREEEPGARLALLAHARLVSHLQRLEVSGDPDPALGGTLLAALLGAPEGVPADLGALAALAADERARMRGLLEESSRRLAPDLPVEVVVARLADDHPEPADLLHEAQALTDEVLRFTRDRGLVDAVDGECLVAPSPESRRWATASLSWAAPYEADAPSTYAITSADPSWSPERQREWLSMFNRAVLPSTTAHEVAPGHFAHSRALRRASGQVRRTFYSPAFVEGWAHYAEELMVEEGFRAEDPRFAVGVAVLALLRVTRLEVALALHTGTMTVPEAARQFEEQAFLRGAGAEAEALRAVIDPSYGRYTTGKVALLQLRDRARVQWGDGFTLDRFHSRLLALGAPPLGLLDAVLDDHWRAGMSGSPQAAPVPTVEVGAEPSSGREPS